jgi:predicted Zn-dependent peptidase
MLTGVTRKTLEDRVRLPRLYLAWLTPRHFAPGDAALDLVSAVLTGGKNSRLYKRLVYDMQIAQDVSAFQSSAALGSQFVIVATARPGHTPAELNAVIDEELKLLQSEPPTAREVQRSLNQIEASFYRGMERVGGFGGKADQLNAYFAGGGGSTTSPRISRATCADARRRRPPPRWLRLRGASIRRRAGGRPMKAPRLAALLLFAPRCSLRSKLPIDRGRRHCRRRA